MSITFRRDADSGGWTATYDGYYHSTGLTKEQALGRLWEFIRSDHPTVFPKADREISSYLNPPEGVKP